MRTRWLVRLAIGMVPFAVFVGHIAGWWPMRLLSQLAELSYDFRVVSTLKGGIDPRIVIVDIDEASLAAEGQWPWRRDRLADLLDRLFAQYRVSAVGFDIDFAEADHRSGLDRLEQLAQGALPEDAALRAELPRLRQALDTDRRFADALRNRPVVLGVVFRGGRGADALPSGALCPPALKGRRVPADSELVVQHSYTGVVPALAVPGWRCGFIDDPTLDDDGVYRRMPLLQEYDGRLYPSLALALAQVLQRGAPIQLGVDAAEATHEEPDRLSVGTLTVPVDEQAAIYIPFRGPQFSFPYVSAVDVLNGLADADVLRNAVVIVGTTAAGLLDQRITPVARNYAGVEVHANILAGLLDADVLEKAPYYQAVEAVLLLLITLLMALGLARLGPFTAAAATLALVVALFAAAYWFWLSDRLVVPLGVPVAFVVAQFLLQQLYGYFVENRRSRNISKLFGHYVPPAIVTQLAGNPASVSMETDNREMTVLFSDIRGFTAVAEQFRESPRELSEMMNAFLGALTEVVFRHHGTIDKYLGDAVMAFWGAPLNDPGHVNHALQAALELPRALRRLDGAFAARGWPPLQIGIGLNTGMMTVGNMGSRFRVAYTVLGEAVNQASRIEGLTKIYGVEAICGQATRAAAGSAWVFQELDRVRLQGASEPVSIYRPLGHRDAVPQTQAEAALAFERALDAYRNRRWDAARAQFSTLAPRQPPALCELYLARIAYFRQHPPAADWDGTFVFEHK
jgi:adenylate cyclase